MSANVYQLNTRASTESHSLSTARVTGQAGETFLLDHPRCTYAAAAVSCLLKPQPGDTVLLSESAAGTDYILAILERPDAAVGTLHLPGDNEIALSANTMQINTGSLQLKADQQIDINGPAVNLTAISAEVTVKHWRGWFDTVESSAVSVQITAKTLVSRLGRMVQRMAESFKQTDGLDEVRAGRTRIQVDGHHQVNAGHITTAAKGFVKIDGQKIDLG